MKVRLLLLGSPELWLGEKRLHLPTRKLLGLLAYLALEGPTPRSTLAALLWEAGDERARANLRNEFYRLKKTPLAEAVRENQGLLYLDNLETDVGQFERFKQAEQYAEAQRLYRGPLLSGLELDDAPAFEDWLELSRAGWEERHNAALLGLARHLRQAGQVNEALEVYQQFLNRDPLLEEVWQESIALWAGVGQVAKALEQYGRYAAFLERELGLAPSRETRMLAETLRTGRTRPASGLGSPPLVGRGLEWEWLKSAWQAGKRVLIEGEPGVGKTRLLQEFITAQGARLGLMQGRPGDAGVLYASASRWLEQALPKLLLAELAPWVRRELARLLPDLDESPPPLQGQEDRLRLFKAILTVLLRWQQTERVVLGADDVQFVDGASLELLDYLMAELAGTPFMLAYRPDELSPRGQALIQHQMATGAAVELALAPLEVAGLEELLGAMPLPPATRRLARPLHRLTGGNPLFVLETLRSLEEQGQLEMVEEAFEAVWRNLPRSQRVERILRQRLERLPPEALELLRLAALAAERYTPRLAAQVLQKSPLSIAENSDLLERTGLLKNRRFAHDLLLETAQADIAPATRRYLHGRLLEALAAQDEPVPAAVLLVHAIGAGEPHAIVQFSLQAAQEARRLAAWPQALAHLERALQMLQGDPVREASVRLEREEIFYRMADPQAQEAELQHLEALGQPALASELAYRRGRLARVQGNFEKAAHWLGQSQSQAARLERVYALEHLGIYEGAHEAALEVWNSPNSPESAFRAALLLAELSLEQAQPTEALEWYHRAETHTQASPVQKVPFLRSKARFLYHTGEVEGAIALGQQGLTLAQELHLQGDEVALSHNLAVALHTARRTREALDQFAQTEALARGLGMEFLWQTAQTHRALIEIGLGTFEQAAERLQTHTTYATHYRAMLLALALVHLGKAEEAREQIIFALPGLRAHAWHAREARYVAALVETCASHPEASERWLRETLQTPEPTLRELCQSLLAFNLLQQGRLEEALETSSLAHAHFPEIQADLPIQQVAWVQAQVLHRLGQKEAAREALQQADGVLQESLAQLPPDQRPRYLQAFAYNRAIQAALKGRWPDVPLLL
ncbi:MAG: AAA family ATPase [Meiothermus sp.]|nr:AAA family ATPase [Meiothermus sp.]